MCVCVCMLRWRKQYCNERRCNKRPLLYSVCVCMYLCVVCACVYVNKEKSKQKSVEEEYASLVERVSKLLDSSVKEVRVSHRLTDSAACLAVDDNDMGLQMRKIMEASGQSVPETKPILELNPQHPLVTRLDKEQDEERFGDIAAVLFGQASLAEGGQLSDPADFTSKLNKLLLQIN